ncbi:MAG: hypothetical protein KJO69_01915 [Gammaproteobacteria bacterium]|nr:hypothetical protein [Gammaproteobacteria bacterium]
MSTFDFTKIKDFDKHIEMSIPNYDGLANVFRQLANHYSDPSTLVLDIGCSTGKFLGSLERKDDMGLVGIDIVDIVDINNHILYEENEARDALEDHLDVDIVSVVISMFTLQFMSRNERKDTLEQMRKAVANGAVVLVAEKICMDDATLQTEMLQMHMEEKRKNFTDKQILDKNAELSNSMRCVTEAQLLQELYKIGLPTRVWQSYNFVGYIIK